MRTIGLDIGTTTICAVLFDTDAGRTVETAVIPNDSFVETGNSWEKAQNPERILSLAAGLVKSFLDRYSPVDGIGVTGQMHGIVYLDSNGNAVSPLYTWQDARGDLPFAKNQSYSEYLSEMSNSRIASGFGAATHFYNQQNRLIPDSAKVFCTIHDYVAMKLAQRSKPLLHPSDAASFGLYKIHNGKRAICVLDEKAGEVAGMDLSFFPEVGEDYTCLGCTAGGVPVYSAIGDNQASFIGSVKEAGQSILLNVGTGSQISLLSEEYYQGDKLETRPYLEGSFLVVGSSLCGGRAYALAKQFFDEFCKEAGFEYTNTYAVLDRLAEKGADLPNPLIISTKFSGTRQNPLERGSISNIGIDNFTPAHFSTGILQGIVNELYELYCEYTEKHDFRPDFLVGSGNGIRKGKTLCNLFSRTFNAPLNIPAQKEEAAFGAALYALVGAGGAASISRAQEYISY